MSRVGALLVLAACSEPNLLGDLSIERIVPDTGSTATPTPVRVEGRDFELPVRSNVDNGVTKVGEVAFAIGDVGVTDARWTDESLLEGTVPAGLVAGTYDVTVKVGDRTSVVKDGFTIFDPAVTGVDAGVDGPLLPPSPWAMTGQRWLLPCSNKLSNFNCNCSPQISTQQTLTGSGNDRWFVTARFRGVMEAIGYTGGVAGPGGWYEGGAPADTANNTFSFKVSSPPRIYYINRGTPTAQQSFAFDFTVSFLVDGNATIEYVAAGQDTLQWGNYDASHTPITIQGVTTTPSPYDGQFAQIDVQEVTRQ